MLICIKDLYGSTENEFGIIGFFDGLLANLLMIGYPHRYEFPMGCNRILA